MRGWSLPVALTRLAKLPLGSLTPCVDVEELVTESAVDVLICTSFFTGFDLAAGLFVAKGN